MSGTLSVVIIICIVIAAVLLKGVIGILVWLESDDGFVWIFVGFGAVLIGTIAGSVIVMAQ